MQGGNLGDGRSAGGFAVEGGSGVIGDPAGPQRAQDGYTGGLPDQAGHGEQAGGHPQPFAGGRAHDGAVIGRLEEAHPHTHRQEAQEVTPEGGIDGQRVGADIGKKTAPPGR